MDIPLSVYFRGMGGSELRSQLSYSVTRQQAQHCGKLCLKDVS